MSEDPYASVIPRKLKIAKSSESTSSKPANMDQAVPKQFVQTQAEEIFHRQRLERLAAQKEKQPQKTYKEAIKAFNQRLEQTSEHYDIPKVGPG
ncbi:hypothetical protein MDAP_000679 [Mitosporidium daphniae]|uniref:Uncharacterized protein n=1 Tax=Mitosporidium daphniae TaxID=1485682 RepID=A0A098VS78_9MICR|nr:uncharacterized protein DI09_24p40 [Mitosporidium daphniae]KGG51883.1 hypothetical protein DI09_24p40 [Mitosporidium daphniae]|eukprot:XP_013238344.1 uncharacterized protein DI09_24p40 [Mitosporidium daphniae]